MECEGSVETRFTRFVPKLAEDRGKLRIHFLTINFVKFGGSSAYGNARGRRSMNKKSGLGNKLINIVNRDMPQSSRLFRHYLLVVGIRLFKNSKCVTNDGISREKERDSPYNDRSNKLDNVVRGRDAARKRR